MSGDPQRAAQPSIAELERQVWPRAVSREAAKVSRFGDDRQCIDQPDAWDLSPEEAGLALARAVKVAEYREDGRHLEYVMRCGGISILTATASRTALPKPGEQVLKWQKGQAAAYSPQRLFLDLGHPAI